MFDDPVHPERWTFSLMNYRDFPCGYENIVVYLRRQTISVRQVFAIGEDGGTFYPIHV